MEFCADPKALDGVRWLFCYLTTPKHFAFYLSFGTVFAVLALATPLILILGFSGAFAQRSRSRVLRFVGHLYGGAVRGVPDVIFFLFVPLALDQAIEALRFLWVCPSDSGPIFYNNEFRVCAEAKFPLSTAEPWAHSLHGFVLALVSFALVFGAFAANVLEGAMRAVPSAQLETARAFGMTRRQIARKIVIPQMLRYALPGLSNLWMLLIKATPLLFLLGVQDIVYYARELGAAKVALYEYPHPDWRLYYFGFLLVFYLALTKASEAVFVRIEKRLNRGHEGAVG